MIGWTIAFLIIALIAALFGFTSIMGTSIAIAKVIFFIFIILFVLSFFFGRKPPVA